MAGVEWSGSGGALRPPDMLNILLEPFQRWAAGQGCGIVIRGGEEVASCSFADDVVLIAPGREKLLTLVSGYLEWCRLLGLRVQEAKTQVWTNKPDGRRFRVGAVDVDLAKVFKIVKIVIGEEPWASEEHYKQRAEDAKLMTSRLGSLAVPVGLKSRIWRAAPLAKALYGCEVRDITPKMLEPLAVAARAVFCASSPVCVVRQWAAPEALMGKPVGDLAFREPMVEMRCRQLRWLQRLTNSVDRVGRLHRALATENIGDADPLWKEPTRALEAACRHLGCKVSVNWDGWLVSRESWPRLREVPPLDAEVVLVTREDPVVDRAAFTDGSVKASGGGAAAVSVDGDRTEKRHIQSPRSSTHCELAAIELSVDVLEKEAVYTDSLASLHILGGFASWPIGRQLRCQERTTVRKILCCRRLKLLEKVKAHRTDPMVMVDPKAWFNVRADLEADRAAIGGADIVEWQEDSRFADAVLLIDSDGRRISSVDSWAEEVLWQKRCAEMVARRPQTLGKLYEGRAFDWKSSNVILRTPGIAEGHWNYWAPPGVAKWVVRARVGALATSERRRKTDGRKGPGGGPAEAAHCPCCPEVKEDDMHMLTGCPGTGTDGVVEDFLTFWGETLHEVKVSPKEQFSPTKCWGESWKLQLAVGLIPMQLRELCLMVFSRESTLIHVLQKVSVKMGSWLADRMRDREARRAVNGVPQRARGEQPLPGLSAREVRETLRVTMDDATPSAVPAHGDARMRWASNSAKEWILSLARGVLEDGPTGVQLLATWENQTGEEFTKDPPAPVVARINSWGVFLARTMSTLIPHTKSVQGRVSRWGVVLRDAVDANVWRTEKEEAERGRVVRPRAQLRAAVDLVGWINQFEAADCVDAAESDEAASGLALLTLWELEHGMRFPAQGSGIYFVKAFARALGIALKSAKEPFRLCATAYVKRPLAQNMTPVRHMRFPIAIRRPLGHAFWPAWKEALVSLLRSRRDRGIRVARRGGRGGEAVAGAAPEGLSPGASDRRTRR